MPQYTQMTHLTVQAHDITGGAVDDALARIRKSLEGALAKPVRGDLDVRLLVAWNEEDGDGGTGQRHESPRPA